MIQGHHRSESPCDMPCTRSTAGSQSETGEPDRKKNRWQPCTSKQWLRAPSGRLESSDDKGATNLPNEMVVKILSSLDIRTIYACRHVSKSWKALVDENHLPALSFSRGLHYQPASQTVKNYHSSTRDWLTLFGDEGEKLAEELDQHLENKHFPEMLFLAIAKVLARTILLTCQNVGTVQNYWGIADLSPDGQYLVTVPLDTTEPFDKKAKILGLVNGQWQEKATIGHEDSVIKVSFSRDGQHLVTTSKDNTAQIWELVNGQWQKQTTITHEESVSDASFSLDGQYLVTTSKDKTSKICRLVGGQWQKKTTIEHGEFVRGASFSPDGHQIVTASHDKTAQIWELVDDQWQEQTTITHDDWVNLASFSPNGRHLVTASDDKTAKIWELVGGQPQEKATIQHDERVRSACFSPDGQYLVTGSHDKTAQIWELVNSQWQKKHTIQHDEPVSDVSFSPNGQHLVTASHDKTAQIWGLVNDQWQEKATIHHDLPVKSASFSAHGRHLLTVDGGSAKIWLIKPKGEEEGEAEEGESEIA